MTRYSRNNRSNRYRKNNKPSYFGLWMFTIILFIIFTVGLVYIGKHKSNNHRNEAPEKNIPAAKLENMAAKKEELTEKIAPKPKVESKPAQTFEFYNILTQDKVDAKSVDNTVKTSANTEKNSDNNAAGKTSSSNSKQTKSADVAAVKPKTKNPLYVLEILKTKDFEVVDHVKAELALIGYEINIATVKNNNTAVYDVTVGPFNSKDKAIANQKQLNQYNVKSVVKQM